MRPAGEALLHAANEASCVDEPEMVNAAFAFGAVEDHEPPFDPPDEGDFDAIDEEEEALFVRADELDFEDEAADDLCAPEVEARAFESKIQLNTTVETFVEAEAVVEVIDEEPPFDAPDDRDECFQPPLIENNLAPLIEQTPLLLTTGERPRPSSSPTPSFPRDPRIEEEPAVRPAPAITVLACWDRPETGDLIARAAADQRLARAEFFGEIGGVDAAIDHAEACTPDLVIVESALPRDHLLAGIDSLLPRLGANAKIIVLGAVNDITLLRDLALRGVSQYIVPPIVDEALVRAICTLYADADNARTIAVIGARGGVGVSTLAYNLAWSIAERQQVRAAVLDLDVAFGTAAFNANGDANLSAAAILAQPDALAQTSTDARLRLITAPATLETLFEPEVESAVNLVTRVRRESPFVVLDVPHAWCAWVKQTLISADEVVIVVGPDLASLRNAEQILRVLRGARGEANAPLVVLSMTGVPKRPEIASKDFTETLATSPIATFPFEPDIFGVAEVARQALGQSAPRSKAAITIDRLATMLTGREVAESKRRTPKLVQRPQTSMSHPLPEPAQKVVEPTIEPTDLGPPIVIEPFEQAPPCATATEPVGPRPFTFRADAQPLELTQRAPEEEALDLAKARDAAVANVASVQAKHVRRGRPGLLRAAACLLMLILVGVWHMQNQRAASAAPPERATPTVAPVAPTPAVQTPRSPAEQYEAALQTLASGAVEQGVAQLQSAAESGLAPAQYQLAKLYEHGQGVETDLTLARQWTERAAASGDSRAMHDLGVYFARGEGVAADNTAAFRWFRQAAELGVVDSQYNLAILYEEGRGVTQDEQEALFWFLSAGRAGDLIAIQRANALEPRLTPMQVDQAHARALAFRARTTAP